MAASWIHMEMTQIVGIILRLEVLRHTKGQIQPAFEVRRCKKNEPGRLWGPQRRHYSSSPFKFMAFAGHQARHLLDVLLPIGEIPNGVVKL